MAVCTVIVHQHSPHRCSLCLRRLHCRCYCPPPSAVRRRPSSQANANFNSNSSNISKACASHIPFIRKQCAHGHNVTILRSSPSEVLLRPHLRLHMLTDVAIIGYDYAFVVKLCCANVVVSQLQPSPTRISEPGPPSFKLPPASIISFNSSLQIFSECTGAFS